MAETILITGGSGFIGLQLARRLMAEGDTVVVFDLKPPEPLSLGDNATFVRGDITNFSQVLNAVRDHRPDGVIHLAALLSEPSERNPWASISINASRRLSHPRSRPPVRDEESGFSSSIAVYAGSGRRIVTEDTPQRPRVIYGITKVFSELLARYYHSKFGLDARGVRLPVLVGPNVDSPGFAQYNSLLIQSAILGKPFKINVPEETVAPLLYVKDAIRSIAMLYRAPEKGLATRIYNVGQIIPAPSAAEIVEMVKKYCPDAQLFFEPEPLATEMIRYSPVEIRCDEARAEWGWSIEYSLEDMVKDFVAILKKSGDS